MAHHPQTPPVNHHPAHTCLVVWMNCALAWLVIGSILWAVGFVYSIPRATQAAKDAFTWGFCGMSCLAQAWFLINQYRAIAATRHDIMMLMAAFWCATTLAVMVAQAVVGHAWIITGLPVTWALAIGTGALLGLKLGLPSPFKAGMKKS